MHAAYFRPGGVSFDLPYGLLDSIYVFNKNLSSRIDEMEEFLTNNRIWKQRLINIGIVSAKDAIDWGFTGVMLRGSGVSWDLRKSQPYEMYSSIDFDIPVGVNGDCYDRYLIRIKEMRESIKIVNHCIFNICEGPVNLYENKSVIPSKNLMKKSMESLIHFFKLYAGGFIVPSGETYVSIEAPKGEFGVS